MELSKKSRFYSDSGFELSQKVSISEQIVILKMYQEMQEINVSEHDWHTVLNIAFENLCFVLTQL